MKRAFLIALLVPAVSLAAPRKKPKKKKKVEPPEETDKEDKVEAPTPDPPAATPTTTPATSGTKPGSGPAAAGSGASTPTVPTVPAKPGTPAGTTPVPGKPGSSPGGTPVPGTPATTGKPAAEPEPDEPKATKDVDVDTLRQEYLSLRDELFKSRARANAVASQLYSTRVTIKFTWGSARHYGVSKASIRLDGATVFEDSKGAIANDDGIRFNGYVAPGRHLITFHVEATGKDDDSFTSATETQIVVKAVANKDLLVTAKGRDNGNIAYEWKRSEKGNYGLGIDVAVKSVAQGAKK